MAEFDTKQERIHALLAEHQIDALLLQRVSSFAWATCGAASYINTASSTGEAALLITPSRLHLITNNIEAPRLEAEERLAEQGWEFHAAPWYEAAETVARLAGGLKLGSDGQFPGATDVSGALARLRSDLTPEERERFRRLGQLCAGAIQSTVQAVRPGQTEFEIAAHLACEAEWRGMQAIVNLIATDERVYRFRHPLPTQKELERYAMLVLCGRRWGLVCSVTRLVHFGPLPDDLRRRARAAAQVDAAVIAATRPGRRLGDIFQLTTEAYADAGFDGEWQWHHQGGPAGYEPRELVATPGSQDRVQIGQAYAWNPSVAGAKSEDTILVGDVDNEVLTDTADLPTLPIVVEGREIDRPAILEVL
jgi:antitoxin VapB